MRTFWGEGGGGGDSYEEEACFLVSFPGPRNLGPFLEIPRNVVLFAVLGSSKEFISIPEDLPGTWPCFSNSESTMLISVRIEVRPNYGLPSSTSIVVVSLQKKKLAQFLDAIGLAASVQIVLLKRDFVLSLD